MAVEQAHPPGYEPHIGESRQYWRDIILGVNDGLVSIFLLVIGLVGGGLASDDILLASIAAAVAGAISMAAGEYLATKSQDEVLTAELRLERTHIARFRDNEMSPAAASGRVDLYVQIAAAKATPQILKAQESAGKLQAPKLAVTATGTVSAAIPIRARSATAAVAIASRPGSTSTNSSPP